MEIISRVAKQRDAGSVSAKAALDRLDNQATYHLLDSSLLTDGVKNNAKRFLLAAHPPTSPPMITLGSKLSRTKNIMSLKTVSDGEMHALILGQRTLGTADLGGLRKLAMSYAEGGAVNEAVKRTFQEKRQAYRWLKALGENGDKDAAAAAKSIKADNPTLLT